MVTGGDVGTALAVATVVGAAVTGVLELTATAPASTTSGVTPPWVQADTAMVKVATEAATPLTPMPLRTRTVQHPTAPAVRNAGYSPQCDWSI